MTFLIYITYALFEQMNSVTGLAQVFAGVADTEFGCDSAHIYIGRVKKFQNLSKSLACLIDAIESGILFLSPASALVKGQLFVHIWCEVLVNFTTTGACDTVCRPCSALLLE